METLPIEICERRLVPDAVIRAGMRRLMASRLHDSRNQSPQAQQQFLEHLSTGAIAEHTQEANSQHYEIPVEFFHTVLGPQLKYSGCLFGAGANSLETAETAMLSCYAERAGLEDGQSILDLGCGWGSLALWAARRYPNARIVAVSNSASQRRHIEQEARDQGLANLDAVTCDINAYDPGSATFDRIVSVEMFEHMRNYRELLARIRRWLTPDGRLFVHIFCHRDLAYPFKNDSDYDWMARHFFTGGIMPSHDLLHEFQQDLTIQDQWWLPGTHYQTTANAWLARLDSNRARLHTVFAGLHGHKQAGRQIQRWRIFFMAVAELFGYHDGREWGIGHYLLRPA